jgi:hypothetical protein
MSSISDKSVKSPLDAAQSIVAELKGMASEDQSLALRFASETLRLQLPAALSPTAAQPVISAQPTPPHAASGADHSTDIRSFTAMKVPKSDQQFAAVVAYFYQFEAKPDNRTDVIDTETMKEAARLAGRPQVARWRQTLNNAKNAGYLDAAGNGRFRLSSVGENLVAITLPDDSRQGQGKSNNTNKKPKKQSVRKSVKRKGGTRDS